MAFWRVAGFAQPSPIEQILDKEECTLEELLDEDDIIQECKSLNGRLIAFLREKNVVEQLLRYLVQPPSDPDDPKKQYKYPFTSCEVFCCEVEAIFNTLLEDEALLDLLFSLLDAEPPLSCKTAGYFGRVVGQLLLRKTNEMMQYLSNHDGLLEKLVRALDVTSIADVIKRLAGADEQSSMVFLPMHTQWLVDTPLLDMLLERLGPGWSSDTVTNAADVLTAIAHTQPSALSAKLMQPGSISALFGRALEPGGRVIVPALEVCSALLRPRRGGPGGDAMGSMSGCDVSSPGSGGGADCTAEAAAAAGGSAPRIEALGAMLGYLPQLVGFLSTSQEAGVVQETPYGVLAPPLGRARLKVVELLAVLLQVGDEGVEGALMATNAMALVMQLFAQYPFNNLLHHQVYSMLAGLLQRASPEMVAHTFGACRLVGWLSSLPTEVLPQQRPGGPEVKGKLRAGYLGHVTLIANLLVAAAAQKQPVADVLAGDEEWQWFVAGDLQRRNELEDLSHWECGRPASTEVGELGSDADDFQNDLDLEQMQGMQPALYHRYGVLDDGEDEDEGGGVGSIGRPDVGAAGGGGSGDYGGAEAYGTMLAATMQNMDISTVGEDIGGGVSVVMGGGGREMVGDELPAMGAARGEGADVVGPSGEAAQGAAAGHVAGGQWSLMAHQSAPNAAAASEERSMEDDTVLLATSDDEEDGGGGPPPDSIGSGGGQGLDAPAFVAMQEGTAAGDPGDGGGGSGAAAGGDDVVMEEAQGLPDDAVEGAGGVGVAEAGAGDGPAGMDASAGPGASSTGDDSSNRSGSSAEPGAAAAAAAVAGVAKDAEEGFTDHAPWEGQPLPGHAPPST